MKDGRREVRDEVKAGQLVEEEIFHEEKEEDGGGTDGEAITEVS
jgi:hypothetical protein